MRIYTHTIFHLVLIALYSQGISQATTSFNFLKQPGLLYLLGEPELNVEIPNQTDYDIPRLFTFKNDFTTWDKSSAFAFINKDYKLFLSCAPYVECPTCVGCKCVKYFSGPHPVLQDLDLSKTTGIAITDIVAKRFDTSLVNIALNTDRMKIMIATFKVTDNKYIQISTSYITLQPSKTDQSINGITAFSSNRIIVYGQKGLLRVISINENQEENHDVDSTENLICGGEQYVGSEDGSVYRIAEKSSVAELGVPLIYISSSGAAGQNGLIAEHTNNGWEKFNTTLNSPRYLNFLTTYRGREICMVNDSFNLIQIVLHNQPTTLKVDSPQILASSLNGPVFSFFTHRLEANFSLSNPEGNIDPPQVSLHTKDTIKPDMISLVNSFERPSYMSRKLTNNKFSIVFTSDSVIFSASCTESQCYWESTLICDWGPEKPYSISFAWNNLDTLFLSAGKDTLRIMNQIPISTRPKITSIPHNIHYTVSKTVSWIQH